MVCVDACPSFATPTSPRSQQLPAPSPTPPEAERGRDYLKFIDVGRNELSFRCLGIIHALPPQPGVPGRQRITFMKRHEPDPSNSPIPLNPATAEADQFYNIRAHSRHWAYEGVVLPGGMIMLGRCWTPTDQNQGFMGPFMFWNVHDKT